MRGPRSYVVRIYRQGYRNLSGIVEDTHTSNTQPFRTIEELVVLLRAPIAKYLLAEHRGRSRATNK